MHVSIRRHAGRQSMQKPHMKQQAFTCSRYVIREVQNNPLDSFKVLEIVLSDIFQAGQSTLTALSRPCFGICLKAKLGVLKPIQLASLPNVSVMWMYPTSQETGIQAFSEPSCNSTYSLLLLPSLMTSCMEAQSQ